MRTTNAFARCAALACRSEKQCHVERHFSKVQEGQDKRAKSNASKTAVLIHQNRQRFRLTKHKKPLTDGGIVNEAMILQWSEILLIQDPRPSFLKQNSKQASVIGGSLHTQTSICMKPVTRRLASQMRLAHALPSLWKCPLKHWIPLTVCFLGGFFLMELEGLPSFSRFPPERDETRRKEEDGVNRRQEGDSEARN